MPSAANLDHFTPRDWKLTSIWLAGAVSQAFLLADGLTPLTLALVLRHGCGISRQGMADCD